MLKQKKVSFWITTVTPQCWLQVRYKSTTLSWIIIAEALGSVGSNDFILIVHSKGNARTYSAAPGHYRNHLLLDSVRVLCAARVKRASPDVYDPEKSAKQKATARFLHRLSLPPSLSTLWINASCLFSRIIKSEFVRTQADLLFFMLKRIFAFLISKVISNLRRLQIVLGIFISTV